MKIIFKKNITYRISGKVRYQLPVELHSVLADLIDHDALQENKKSNYV